MTQSPKGEGEVREICFELWYDNLKIGSREKVKGEKDFFG